MFDILDSYKKTMSLIENQPETVQISYIGSFLTALGSTFVKESIQEEEQIKVVNMIRKDLMVRLNLMED